MKVTLSSGYNPDRKMDHANRSRKETIVSVSDLKEAREKCVKYRDENMLGGGNWTGGKVTDDEGNFLAQISYNGRVWDREYWTSEAKEIII